jgi:hypothetical protein
MGGGGGGRLSFWGIPYVLDQAVTQEIDQKYNCKVERKAYVVVIDLASFFLFPDPKFSPCLSSRN